VIAGFEPRLNGSLTRRPLSPSHHSPPPRVPTGHHIPAQSTALGTPPRTHPHVLKERRSPARPQRGLSNCRSWTRNNVAYKLANVEPITWESSDDDAQAIVGQVAKRLPGGNIGATVGGGR
jgi:hypothetical protein